MADSNGDSSDIPAIIDSVATLVSTAARSELGIIALIVLALAAVAVIFFRNEADPRYRLVAFVLLFFGFAGFAFSIQVQFLKADPAELPSISSSNNGEKPKCNELGSLEDINKCL